MLQTKSGLPKHCGWNVDRHGKRRVRFRLGEFSTYLTGTPWSEDFMRQYAAAFDGVTTPGNIGATRTKLGSFDALVVSYYRSPDFLGLAPSTQALRRNILENFRKLHGFKPIRLLRREHIKEVIAAKVNAPEAANLLLKVQRIVLAYAVDQDMIVNNPAAGVKKYKSKGDGHHSWTEAEIAQFEAKHPVGSRARLALTLGLYTAQRKSDVLRMGWQHIEGDMIAVRQAKTNTALLIPMHPKLGCGLILRAEDQPHVSSDRTRCAVRPQRLRQLVAYPVRRRWAEALFVSRLAQSSGDAVGERRLHRRYGAVDHRTPFAGRGRSLHQGGGSGAARPSGDQHADQDGRRTKFVQPRYPVGQNGGQVMESKQQNFAVGFRPRNPTQSPVTTGRNVVLRGKYCITCLLENGRFRPRKTRDRGLLLQVGVFGVPFDVALGERAHCLDLQALAAGGVEHAPCQR
jgi:integrase